MPQPRGGTALHCQTLAPLRHGAFSLPEFPVSQPAPHYAAFSNYHPHFAVMVFPWQFFKHLEIVGKPYYAYVGSFPHKPLYELVIKSEAVAEPVPFFIKCEPWDYGSIYP